MKKIIISPSVLSADFTDLKNQLEQLNSSKAQWLHYDVMDGHFVPNLTFGPDILKQINKISDRFIDVHIMVDNPVETIEYFKDCHIDMMTFHYEAKINDIDTVIDLIHEKGWKAGISIKPKTNVKVLRPYLDKVDLVLIMSVEPGFGGQSFMEESLEKISWLDQYRNSHKCDYIIEVDGGINEQNIRMAEEAGCDAFVAGSFVFKHPEGIQTAVERLMD